MRNLIGKIDKVCRFARVKFKIRGKEIEIGEIKLLKHIFKCFPAGTPILMGDGNHKPIEQVKAGDSVISRDAKTGATSVQKVVQTFERQAGATVALTFANGERIETTPEHPFYVESQGFTAAKELGIGTSIVTRDKCPSAPKPVKTSSRKNPMAFNDPSNPPQTDASHDELEDKVGSLGAEAMASDQQDVAWILTYLYVAMQTPESLAKFRAGVEAVYRESIAGDREGTKGYVDTNLALSVTHRVN